MQNDTFRQQYVPDKSMTYSTASSFYRDPEPEPTGPKYAAPLQFPSPEILLGGYNGNHNAFRKSMSRQVRQRRSPSLSDPIQTHLLVETALGDCREYEVLSFEELETLKKEDFNLRKRTDAVRKKLALETKVRDAAKSLTRLHSQPSSTSSSPRLNRRSTGASKRETVDKAESELAAATKRCDELSRELYHLEQRSRQAQMKILQHTAGILQVTHRGVTKNAGGIPFIPGGRPESPASLDGYNGKGLLGEELDFDRGFLNEPSNFDGFLDELKAEKPPRRLSRRISREATMQREVFLSVTKRLEELYEQIREVIAQTNSDKAQGYRQFPQADLDTSNLDATINQQLEFLSQGLEDVRVEQSSAQRESQSQSNNTEELSSLEQEIAQLQSELQTSLQENLALQKDHDTIEDAITDQLSNLNNQLYEIITSTSSKNSVPPIPYDDGPIELIRYTEERIGSIKGLIQSSATNANQSREVDTVLQGLWQYILGAEEEIRERKRAERQQLAAKQAAGDEIDSDDELSPDEEDGLSEEFSLPAFNTKVQWLVNKSTYLKEKQSSLRRKVKKHREIASRSMGAAPAADELRAQLERTNDQYATAKEELQDIEARFAQLQDAQDEKDARIRTLQQDLEDAVQEAQDEAKIATAELRAQLEETEQKAKSLEAEIASVTQQHEEENRSHLEQEEALRKTEAELRELESEVVRLTTELTISKAELDVAYGSRSQRAADWAAAANTEASKKLDELEARNLELAQELEALQTGGGGREETLKKELQETLREFKDLTEASVEAEREREELEVQVDQLREKTAELENLLAEERVKALGTGGPNSPGGAVTQSTSAMMLKNEFKKMMRDTRTEHMKALRAEQDERRRLEALVRTLKRGGSGKSSLSYTMMA